MFKTSPGQIIRVAVGAAAFALAAGCAQTAHSIDSPADITAASSVQATPVVFGKLALIRNGEAVKFGDGPFASTATLNIHDVDRNRQFSGEVGADGMFSWRLPPGTYRVDSVAFRYQNQTVQPETNFTFTVSPDHDASYLGTVGLEATFDAGYLGVSGGVDRFTVWNECATDCAPHLDQLGLSSVESSRSLFTWNRQATTVARADVTTR